MDKQQIEDIVAFLEYTAHDVINISGNPDDLFCNKAIIYEVVIEALQLIEKEEGKKEEEKEEEVSSNFDDLIFYKQAAYITKFILLRNPIQRVKPETPETKRKIVYLINEFYAIRAAFTLLLIYPTDVDNDWVNMLLYVFHKKSSLDVRLLEMLFLTLEVCVNKRNPNPMRELNVKKGPVRFTN